MHIPREKRSMQMELKHADGDVLTVIKDNLKQVIDLYNLCLELNIQNNQMH